MWTACPSRPDLKPSRTTGMARIRLLGHPLQGRGFAGDHTEHREPEAHGPDLSVWPGWDASC